MRVPKTAGKLLLFDRLDSSGDAVPVYTVGWRIEDEPDDFSRRAIKFKSDDAADFQGGAFVLREAVREVIAHARLDPARTGLTTALSSKATKANDQSVLFRTGIWIAGHTGLTWLPDTFTKKAHQSLHTMAGGAARDAEVDGKYQAAKLADLDTVIMLDDFVTRGATLGEMQRALAATNPKVRMLGLALAKNERRSWAKSCNTDIDNEHIPDDWQKLWIDTANKAGKS